MNLRSLRKFNYGRTNGRRVYDDGEVKSFLRMLNKLLSEQSKSIERAEKKHLRPLGNDEMSSYNSYILKLNHKHPGLFDHIELKKGRWIAIS